MIILSKRAERTANIILFILLLLCINVWGIPQLLIYLLHLQKEMYIAVDKISAFGYTSIPVVFLLFVLSFTNKLYLLRSYIYSLAIFLPPFIFLYFAWNTNLIEARDYHLIEMQYWGYRVPTGVMFPYLILWFESLMIIAMILIIRFYRQTLDIVKKRQAFWLIIAPSIPLIFGTVTNGILPMFNYPIFPSAIPLTSIMAIIIAYAVFRYELFDLTPSTILTNLGNGVITVNLFGKIVQVNDAAKRMLETPFEITGKGFYEIVSLKNIDKTSLLKNSRKLLRNVLQTGDKFESNTLQMISNSKKKFPIECTITPIFQDNRIAGATLIFRDITKEKEIEKSKNEFISIASHELKTPITAIKVFSQALEKRLAQKGDKKNLYFVTRINSQLNKITMLISDLLDVNKIEEGRLVLSKKKFKVNEMISKIVEEYQITLEKHTLIFDNAIESNVYADEERIQQVLINLLSNAIKYSPEADRIVIRCVKEKGQVIISIQDFGIGIPKKDQRRVFDRYFRSDVKEGKNISGFGLGLYISAEIIKRHSGKIWVQSVGPGKNPQGSTFFFTLPMR
jgi:PAS domain S-box-containing protein